MAKFKSNAEIAIESAGNAVALAENALNEAKEALARAGGSVPAAKRTTKPANESKGSKGSKGSAGRVPGPEQVKIRGEIVKRLTKGLQYFTIAELTETMGTDRIQTRNAVNYLEQQGAIVRYGEKLPEGRGQRELIYKAGNLETIKSAA